MAAELSGFVEEAAGFVVDADAVAVVFGDDIEEQMLAEIDDLAAAVDDSCSVHY